MRYVDGFVFPVAKRKIPAYRRMARAAGKVWQEYGALEFCECAGDDLAIKPGMGVAFPRALRLKRGETAFFSFIIYESRAHRDRVNRKVMADPRIGKMMQGKEMPFDVKRMLYGGFSMIVDLTATGRRQSRRGRGRS